MAIPARIPWRLPILLLAILGFHLATLREGHSWGGDFSQYLLHARNLATGLPYGEIPFVPNPDYPDHAPRAYPPVFPLLLAPVYARFGLNFTALKVAVNLFLVLWLGLLYRLARRDLSPGWGLWVVAIAGLSPLVWLFKDEVLPDGPYLGFTLLALAAAEGIRERRRHLEHPWLSGLWLAVIVYLAYGCRSVGIVLLPALLVEDLVEQRRLSRFALALTGFFALLAGGVSLVVHTENSYVGMFLYSWSPHTIADNAQEYVRGLAYFWSNGYLRGAAYLLAVLLSALAGVAFLRRLRERPGAMELYVLFYLALLVMWPSGSGWRYLYPLYPLYVLYVIRGARPLAERLGKPVLVALLAAIGVSFAARYSTFGPLADGIRRASFVELCRFVEKSTEPGDVLLYWNPRVLALMTGRRAAIYSPFREPERGWGWVERSQARYVIVSRFVADDRLYLDPLVERYRSRLEQVFANGETAVYRVR